ncbi:MAG TPA: thioredoxin family protein [Ramlibacter sp.]|nr:thioredoxin family protein [Ramlibacter sp.]
MQASTDPALHEWWVICLCAEWCGTCREWRDPFAQAAAAHPDLRFGWVDVEDEAAAMGDVDIETFPTLLVASGGRPLFFGPILPSGPQLSRLLASLRQDGAAPSGVTPETSALLARLSAVLLNS